jgi:hypothetical protein
MVNLLMGTLDGMAMIPRVFLHERFGSEQPGVAGFLGLVVILLFAANAAPHSPRPVLAFAGLFATVCVLRRLGAGARYLRGDEEHRWHDGYSYVCRLLPVISEEIAKRFVEPVIGLTAAVCAAPYSPPLFCLLAASSFSWLLMANLRAGIQQRKLRRLRDQYIEQRNVTSTFRRYVDDGRF